MNIVAVEKYRGPSLISTKPCVAVSLKLTQEERSILLRYDPSLRTDASDRLQRVSGSIFLNPNHGENPLLLDAAIAVLGALIGEVDPSGKLLRIVQLESEDIIKFGLDIQASWLAPGLIISSIQISMSLYPPEMQSLLPPNIRSRSPDLVWRETCRRYKAAAKSRLAHELISHMKNIGAQWIPLDDYPETRDQIQIGFGRYQKKLGNNIAFESSALGIRLSTSKLSSTRFLHDMGFPATQQLAVETLVEAQHAASSLGYPVVLKKDRGTQGENVYSNLQNPEELVLAFRRLSGDAQHNTYQHNLIFVEKYVQGNDYRLTVVNGRVIAVLHRIPAHVVGDGASTIAQLVEIENSKPWRGDEADLNRGLVALKLGQPELDMLSKQGLTPESVLDKGRMGLLRSTANWSTGGNVVSAADIIHPDNNALAVRVADAFGVPIFGVDIITEDISKSYLESNLRIIEVNHHPAITSYYDEHGQHISQVENVLRALNPESKISQVPVIVSIGNQDSFGDASGISKLLLAAGINPGMVVNDGYFVNGRKWLNRVELSDKDPAFTVLRNAEIDLSFVERDLKLIAHYGVGAGGCDICLIGEAEAINNEFLSQNSVEFQAMQLLVSSTRDRIVILDSTAQHLAYLTNVDADKILFVGGIGDSDQAKEYMQKGASSLSISKSGEDTLIVELRRQSQVLDSADLNGGTLGTSPGVELLPRIALLLVLGFSLDRSLNLLETGSLP